MPYAFALKEDKTNRKDNLRNTDLNPAQEQSRHPATVPFAGAPSSPPAGPGDATDTDALFAHLRDACLAEAQEFRLKGYNVQIPAVNPALAAQLREAIDGARVSPVAMAGLTDDAWRQTQLDTLGDFTRRLSDNAPRWIDHQLGAIHGAPEPHAGNRATAQQLAERLESVLRTLKNVVDVLFPAGDDNTVMPEGDIAGLIRTLFREAEKNRKIASALSATAANFFTDIAEYFASLGTRLSSDRPQAAGIDPAAVCRLRDAVTNARALLNITASTGEPFDMPWRQEKLTAIEGFAARLSEKNVRRWVSHEQAIKNADIYLSLLMPLNAVVQTLTDITEALLSPDGASEFSTFGVLLKSAEDQARATANIAAQRQGSPADFFRDVSQFLEKLHQELKSVSVRQPFSEQGWFNKTGSQAAILLAGAGSLRAGLHGTLLDLVPALNPAMASQRLTAESIVRSILWSWQQTAIKLRHSSRALYTKAKALQPIKDRVLPVNALADGENRDNRLAVQPPTTDGAERAESARGMGEKMAVLTRWLDSDITGARTLLARQGKTTEEVICTLRQQRFAVLKMTHQHLTITAPYLQTLDKLLPGFAARLADAGRALDKAVTAAGDSQPNYREAKERAGEALQLATQAEKELSCTAASLTGRTLDEYARGARLARHWAQIARQQMPQDWVAPDADQTFTLLRNYRLTDGVLSAGDPQGYLFATRLAAEFENARRGELRPPLSPEQYAGLEKGLAEYIVKWGQQRASSGVARLVVTLSFDALGLVIGMSALTGIALRAVKDVIRIPYAVHQLKKFTMPGEDIPFRAINSLLEKKLTQLGFKLAMTPLPGALKFSAGSTITAGAGLRNRQLADSENSFEAVYERVTQGKQSEKIKMASAGQMLTDAVLSGVIMAGYKGSYSALGACMNVSDIDNSAQDLVVPSGAGEQTLPAAADEAWMESGEREEARPRSRGKRSTEVQDALAGGQRLRADQMDFTPQEAWNTFTDDKKKTTYLYAIKQVLRQIENDQSLPQGVRNNAWLARIGAALVVPVDIGEFEINNTFLLPDAPGSKTGVLVNLDSALPYYYVSKGEDLQPTLKWAFPHDAKRKKMTRGIPVMMFGGGGGGSTDFADAEGFLNGIRRGHYKFDDYFNRKNPSAVDIASLSSSLALTIDRDYTFKGTPPENRRLITRATLGSQIPDPGVTATQQQYQLKITWDNLPPAVYLRSFSRPFSTLSGQAQLVVSEIKGQTVQQTEADKDKAEYIGSWVDVSVGAVTAFTPAGWVLGTAQAAAEIGADVAEGVVPDPLAVAGLAVGSIPGGKIAARVGKFSRVGGTSVKYALMVADKTVDLATVGQSIQYACETGEPLAIYQALLDSGMSVKHSYDMARHMSSQIKLSKPLEASASLESLQAVESEYAAYTAESNLPVRTFKIGNTMLKGKIDAGEIRISRDNGVSWQKGSRLHLLAYRLQNAGGGNQLPEAGPSTQINAPARTGAGEPLQAGKAFGEGRDFPFIDNEPGETENALQHLLFSAGPHADKLKRFRDNPHLFCYEAMIETFNVLKAQGEKPRVVGMLVYKNPGDTGPENHFAVRIHKDGADFMVDPTIRQFDAGLPDSATVLPYAEWKQMMKEKAGSGADHFILSKEFDGPLPAKKAVSELQSSMGKYYQSAMIEESNVDILNINSKFKNSIILELRNRNAALSKLKTSSESPEDIRKDIANLAKLKARFNLLAPEEIRPSEKVGKTVKEMAAKCSVPESDIAAIEAGQDSSRDIVTTVTGRHYLKVGKKAWLKIEQGVNENFMRVIHGGQKEIIIRFNKTKNKWKISDVEKKA